MSQQRFFYCPVDGLEMRVRKSPLYYPKAFQCPICNQAMLYDKETEQKEGVNFYGDPAHSRTLGK